MKYFKNKNINDLDSRESSVVLDDGDAKITRYVQQTYSTNYFQLWSGHSIRKYYGDLKPNRMAVIIKYAKQ